MFRLLKTTCLSLLAFWALGAQAASNIVMVLPGKESPTEVAFKDYLQKKQVDAKYSVVQFSGKQTDGPALVEKVRSLKPDLIYVYGTPGALALAGEHDTKTPALFIRDTPIIYSSVTSPLGSRLLAQTTPSGRNITGVSHVASIGVQVNTIRAYRPFKTLGYITNPSEDNSIQVRDALVKLGETAGFKVVNETLPLNAAGAPDPNALPEIIRRIAAKKPDFLYIAPSTFLAATHRDTVTREALAAGLPTFCATESILRRSQCLFGLFSSQPNTGRFAGFKAAQVLVDRVPVNKINADTLVRFSLIVNIPVAKALNFYPPLALLNIAEAMGTDQPAATIVPSFLDGGPPPVAPVVADAPAKAIAGKPITPVAPAAQAAPLVQKKP